MYELTIVQKIAIWALPLIFAITLHEVAHGWVASWFGDQTARLSGRLTVNPIKHIDLVGTIIVPLLMLMFSSFIFGWAKPVPVDPRNLRNPRRDMALVAIAGPISNLIQALFWATVAKFALMSELGGNMWFGKPLLYMGWAGVQINILLGVLNLLPIPPLDGGRIMASLLPPRMAYHYSMIEPYGFVILLILIFTKALMFIMVPPVNFMLSLIATMFGLR